MKSRDQSHDRSNLIETISYSIIHPDIDFLLVICHLTYLIFLVNFPNQSFESTYIINLFNQPTIELILLLAYDILFP